MRVLIGADYPREVIPLIAEAKKNIDIVVYDWRWYEDQVGHPVQQFNTALVRAAQRGVMVRAVVNSAVNVGKLTRWGIRARTTRDRRTLHSKLMLIDGHTLVIGSHNFTRNAFSHNVETSVIVSIPEGVTRLRDFFENLYQL